EVRGRAAHGVDVCAQPDAVFEAQAVQLVELLLGEREGGGARRRKGAQHFPDLLLEVGVFVHARHEAQLRGFGCREDAAGCREIERDLFPDGPLEECHDDGGHEAALHFRITELRRLGLAHCATSISMRSNAVDSTFPWASVLSEMVPPPSSAPCSRKFNAMRFGSS